MQRLTQDQGWKSLFLCNIQYGGSKDSTFQHKISQPLGEVWSRERMWQECRARMAVLHPACMRIKLNLNDKCLQDLTKRAQKLAGGEKWTLKML